MIRRFALNVAIAMPATMIAAILVVTLIEVPFLISMCRDRRGRDV
jgi:hypothetical protein